MRNSKKLLFLNVFLFLLSLNVNSMGRKSKPKIIKYEAFDNLGTKIEITRDPDSGKIKCINCNKEIKYVTSVLVHLSNSIHQAVNYKITFENGKVENRKIRLSSDIKPLVLKTISTTSTSLIKNTKRKLTTKKAKPVKKLPKINNSISPTNSSSIFAKASPDTSVFAKASPDTSVFAKASPDTSVFAKASPDRSVFAKASPNRSVFAKASPDTSNSSLSPAGMPSSSLSSTSSNAIVDAEQKEKNIVDDIPLSSPLSTSSGSSNFSDSSSFSTDDDDGKEEQEKQLNNIVVYQAKDESPILASSPTASSFTNNSSLRSLSLLLTTLQNVPTCTSSTMISSSYSNDVDAQPKENNIVDASPSSTSSRSSNSSCFSTDDKEGKEEQEIIIDSVPDNVIIQNQTPFTVKFTSTKNKPGTLESFMNIILKRDNFTFTLLNGKNEQLNINPLDKDTILLKLSPEKFDYELLNYLEGMLL